MRRAMRRVVGLGLLAGAAYVVWRAIEANRRGPDAAWEPEPFPFPPQPQAAADTAAATESAAAAWVEPVDGACPASHPVKAKLGSGIFHEPGGLNYERTRPDRCYRDGPGAAADGLRAAKH